MPATEMVAMIAVVAALALGFVHLLRIMATAMKYKAMRNLVKADPATATTLLSQLNRTEEPRDSNDERIAIILIAIGIAMVAGCLIAIDDRGMMRVGIAAALFPLLVGGALWLRAYLVERRRAGGQ